MGPTDLFPFVPKPASIVTVGTRSVRQGSMKVQAKASAALHRGTFIAALLILRARVDAGF